jgi:hypothetical protein
MRSGIEGEDPASMLLQQGSIGLLHFGNRQRVMLLQGADAFCKGWQARGLVHVRE